MRHFEIISQVTTEPEGTVVLVGAALDGPAYLPFSLKRDVNPVEALGDSPLAHAYNAAREAGALDIIAYRLNGRHAKGSISNLDEVKLIDLTSVSAATQYNETAITVYSTHLHIKNIDERSTSYFYEKYVNVEELVHAINQDAYYGLVDVNATAVEPYLPLENMAIDRRSVFLNGGDSEDYLITTRDPAIEFPSDTSHVLSVLKERLTVALFGEDPDSIAKRLPDSTLGLMRYGVIVVCDIYHDDDPEFTEILGSFSFNKMKEMDAGCIAVIGTKPLFEGQEDTRVANLLSLSQARTGDEWHRYVQVVVGDAFYSLTEQKPVSLAYGYAALQSVSSAQIMLSNKKISGITKLNSQISKEDIALLSANGYTCIVPSIRRGYVPYLSSSYSRESASLVSRPHCIRTSQYVSRLVTEQLDFLIGDNYTTLTLKDTMKIVEELLDELVNQKVMRSYNLSHELTENNTVLSVEVSLVPFSEVRAIKSIAVVTVPQGVTA